MAEVFSEFLGTDDIDLDTPWEELDALVKEHRADARVRRLTTISKSISKRTGGGDRQK